MRITKQRLIDRGYIEEIDKKGNSTFIKNYKCAYHVDDFYVGFYHVDGHDWFLLFRSDYYDDFTPDRFFSTMKEVISFEKIFKVL